MKANISIISIIICLSMIAVIFSGCANSDNFVPAGMKLISDDIVEYKLYIPESWTADMSTGVASAYYSSSDRSNISMTAYEIDASSTDLSGFWKLYEKDFADTFADLEYEVNAENTLVNGNAAQKYVYKATVSGNTYKFMQTLILKQSRVYLFTYTALESNYDSHIEEVNRILENISFN